MPSERVVRAACPHDCPDTCAMLVTVRDGRAVRVAGNPEHPLTAGFLCGKVSTYTPSACTRETGSFGRSSAPGRRARPASAASAGTAGEIRRVALEYAATQPSLLRLGVGGQRHAGAPVAYRTIACLPALTGAWRHVGGGLSYVPTATANALDASALARADLLPGRAPAGGVRLEQLRERGSAKVDLGQGAAPHAAGRFATPSGRLELRAEGLATRGLDPLPFCDPPAEVADPALAKRFPLCLVTPKTHLLLDTSFAKGRKQHAAAPRPDLQRQPRRGAAGVAASGPVRR